MSYRTAEFNKLNSEFQHAAALLLDNNEPTISKLEYVLDCFNSIIIYSELDFEKKKKATKEHIVSTLEVNRITLKRCYEKLNIPVTLPGKLLSTIHYIPQPPDKPDVHSEPSVHPKPNVHSEPNVHSVTPSTMAQTIEQFLKSAAPLLNYKYSGDPLKLNAFIADADLVQSLASNDDTKAFAFKFIKSRLEGRAEEYVPEDCTSIEYLVKALKEKIKPENSKIIEGKILSLRLKGGDFTKFAADAEKLSEALRRTLIVEGITKAKAEEMTITKTIELCRKNTRADVVKSVLESTKYDTSSEVLATFITQSDIARREYKESQNKPKKPSNNAGNSGNTDNRNKNYNKNRNGGNGQNGNRSDSRNNQRGYNRGRNNQNQQQNRNQNNNRSNRNEHTIRVVTGSQPGPSAEAPPQPQQEQFFRLEN